MEHLIKIKLALSIALLFNIATLSAQEMKVIGNIVELPFAGTPPKDAQGRWCAVVDVYAADIDDISFRSSLIISKENMDGVNWRLYVYVPNNIEKEILICKKGYLPYHLKFPAGFIKEKKLYRVELDCRDEATVTPTTTQQTPMTPPAHEYIDLGLPSGTLWATCNVGASTPEDNGYYFVWNEASINLSSNECIPTRAQFQELKNNCTWIWTTKNIQNGYKVKSKKNGKSIFLPAAGWINPDGKIRDVGNEGDYWTRSGEQALLFDSGYVSTDFHVNHNYSISIRPIQCKK